MCPEGGSIVRRISGKAFSAAGNALIDIIASVPEGFPALAGLKPGSVSHVSPEKSAALLAALELGADENRNGTFDIRKSPGGGAAIACAQAAALGMKATLYGCVGADPEGEWYETALAERGVRPLLSRTPEPTGRFIALYEPDGRKTILVAPSAAPKAGAFDPPEALFAQGGILHLDGLLAMTPGVLERYMARGKAAGMVVSIDFSSEGLVAWRREVLAKAVAECDFVFANEREFIAFCGPDYDGDAARSLEAVAAGKPGVAWILKRGSEGVIFMRGNEMLRIDAPCSPFVDDTGAGDAFAGAFLCGIAESRDIQACMAMGKAASGKMLSKLGT